MEKGIGKKTWWKESVVYQIYPRSFKDSNGDGIGDLQGIISKLPYLNKLGIDIIWICPIYKSPNDDNGYDISDYLNIQKEYGTMQDFDLLLKKSHALGIHIIMDLVINHTSSEHPWFIESRSSKDNSKRDWYIWKCGKDEKEPNNWQSIFGDSAWEYDKKTDEYYLHLFSKKMPDINWENHEAKEAIFDMIHWWLDKGIDGFRVDAISHIKKLDYEDMPNTEGKKYVSSFEKHMNQKGIHVFLQELKENVFAKYDIFTVAEANGVNANEMEEWISSKKGKFSSIFQFEHLNLWDMNSVKRFSLVKMKQVLTKWQKATEKDGSVALVLENHDLTRCINRFGSPDKYWMKSAKCLALMYFMQKGIPFIYQGQEIGMVNADYESAGEFNDVASLNSYHQRIENGMSEKQSLYIMKKATRDNSRTPMQWDSTEYSGFTTSIPWIGINHNYKWLNVEQQEHDKESILCFYKKMIEIRKQHKALIYGTYELLMENSDSIYAYVRKLDRKCYLIACNLSYNAETLYVPYNLLKSKILLDNYIESNEQDKILKPYECRLYQLE